MKKHFDEFFITENGMATPRQGLTIRLNGVTLTYGSWFSAIGGVILDDGLLQIAGRELKFEIHSGVYVITGIYEG